MNTSRVWLITGVNSGLGLALATYVASQGDQVIGSVRSLSKFPETLRKAGVKALVVNFSGTDEEIKASAESALKIFGRVDVLVNNAGFGVFGAVEELRISEIRSQFQTNVFGLLAFTQPIITHLRTRRTGHILNLSSVVSTMSAPSWSAYCASKAAVDAFTDSLHQELKLFGVRVLTLVPGYFSSSFFENLPNHASAAASPSDSPVQESKIYTDVTQGYDSARGIARMHVAEGQIGDPEKYAARVYEVVTGTGLAGQSGVVARATDGSWEGPWEMNRVPLGRDCGEMLVKRLNVLQENVKLFKPVTDSTDVEKERLKYFPRG